MSRCFPFPPPGYVKKTKADDIDLLKKEKHKEKKHRKEKKDKEKKESKEKREKDRSDGKNRDKKDKSDKHREKKDRDKDKSRIADEKRPLGQSESHHNGENLPDEKKLSRKPEHGGEKFIGREKEKDADRISVSVEKKVGDQFPGSHTEKLLLGQFPGYQGEKLPLAPVSKDSKFVQDLTWRSRDEERAATNQFAEKPTATDQKGGEGVFRLAAKTSGTWTEGKEKSKDRRVDDRKPEDGLGIRDGTKSKNAMARNLPGTFQNKAEEIPKPLDRNVDIQIKGKALKAETWQKKGDDKLRENNKEKKNHEKNNDIDKPKKENVKDRSEVKNADLDKFKEVGMVDHMDFLKPKTSELLKDSEKSTVPEKNLKKRKDHETNGFLHANDSKPNKLPRLVSSSDRLTLNGRTVELNHIPTTCTSDKQGAANYIVPDNKDHKPNGIIEAAQPRHASPAKPSLKTVQADLTELTIKPPHPDLKYLTEILTVPKLEVSSVFDDQEWWLLQRSESQSKQSERQDPPEVWAEARWIESGDVYASPYVFPY